MSLQSFFAEARRRRVFRVAAGYLVAVFGALQGVDIVVNALHLPARIMTALVVAAIAGLPLALALAWVFDVTAAGVVRTAPPASTEEPAAAARATRRAALGVLAVVVLLCATGAGIWLFRRRPAAPVQKGTVAVLPFTVRGSAQYAYLGEGLVDLLSTSVGAGGGLRAVDPRALLRFQGEEGPRELDFERGREIAAHFGAALFVLGSVLEVKDRLRIHAALYDAQKPDGPLLDTGAEGEAVRLFELVDDLTVKLRGAAGDAGDGAAAGGGRFEQLARRTTASLPALKDYLEGEKALRKPDFRAAEAAFQRAVAEDPSFALAHYRLAVACSWTSDRELGRVSLRRAEQLSDRLAPREQRLIAAFAAWIRGRAREAEKLYLALVAEAPDDPEAWYQLGEVIFHNAANQGRMPGEARQPFERALALDPLQSTALYHLTDLARIEGRNAELAGHLERLLQLGSQQPTLLRWERAIALGDTPGAAREAAVLEPRDLDAATIRALYQPGGLMVADRLVARLVQLQPDKGPDLRLTLAVVRGQMAEVRKQADLVSSKQPDQPPTRAYLGLLVYVPWTRALLEDARALTEQPWGDEQTPRVRRVKLYLGGILAARMQDAATAAERAAQLEQTTDQEGSRLGQDLALGVRAHLAWAQGHLAETLALLEKVDGGSPDEFFNEAALSLVDLRYLHGEALRALGRGEEALRWYAPFSVQPFESAFWAASQLRQGQILEHLGRRDEAARHYARSAELWHDCDQMLQPMRTEAEQGLARTGTAPAAPRTR